MKDEKGLIMDYEKLAKGLDIFKTHSVPINENTVIHMEIDDVELKEILDIQPILKGDSHE